MGGFLISMIIIKHLQVEFRIDIFQGLNGSDII